MAQIELKTIQIALMAHYNKTIAPNNTHLHICENDLIQIEDMFQIVAIRIQLSAEEYLYLERVKWQVVCPSFLKSISAKLSLLATLNIV